MSYKNHAYVTKQACPTQGHGVTLTNVSTKLPKPTSTAKKTATHQNVSGVSVTEQQAK